MTPVLGRATESVTTWTPRDRYYEQSSSQIWRAICTAVRKLPSITATNVKGLGFDATSSAVIVDLQGCPRSLEPNSNWAAADNARNIILWRDERATVEAERINATSSNNLDVLGGKVHLGVELPRRLWLKQHMPSSIYERTRVLDLCDWLTYRSTDVIVRSASTLYCYKSRSLEESFEANSTFLSELDANECNPFRPNAPLVLLAGQPVGRLTDNAAKDLGLEAGVAVGAALIDSHAGWLGIAAAHERNGLAPDFASCTKRLAVIAGTSASFVAQSDRPLSVPGVWGPLTPTILAGGRMSEGGQNLAGGLVDHIIETHPAANELASLAKQKGQSRYATLNALLIEMRHETEAPSLIYLSRHLHMYPDFDGNRTPIGDHRMRGVIVGLTRITSLQQLALLYHATLVSLGLQLRQILETYEAAGHFIDNLVLSGGMVQNDLFVQTIADVCNRDVLVPAHRQTAVEMGAAMCARMAADSINQSLKTQEQADAHAFDYKHRAFEIMTEMTEPGLRIQPDPSATMHALVEAKYKIFLEMASSQVRWREAMDAIA